MGLQHNNEVLVSERGRQGFIINEGGEKVELRWKQPCSPCEMGGMRRHRMPNLQELEEVSEQSLPWACRGHSPEGNLTGSQRSPCT
jgi:hypothetical protein